MQLLKIVLVCIFAPVHVISTCYQGNCQDIGTQRVCYDSSCVNGGVGCNAGGEGQNCRFCGFDIYPPCPDGSDSSSLAQTYPKSQPTQPPGQCQNLGTQTVCYDPCCSYGQTPAGCDAGGQNQNCRFCGFGTFLACNDVGGQKTIGRTQVQSQSTGDCMSTDSQNCIQFLNSCTETILVGILGGPSVPNGGGFQLNPGDSQNVMFDPAWSGRFWGRTGCFECGQCATGDCNGLVQCNGIGGQPPATLAEITFRGWGGLDYYDISNVDGFNIPLRFAPIDGTFNGPAVNYTCGEANCLANINANCPTDFIVRDVNGNVVACKSACLAYGTPEYCCTGEYSSPKTCQATGYANQVKAECPLAYSYAYDDVVSTFTCKGNSAPSPAYKVTFC